MNNLPLNPTRRALAAAVAANVPVLLWGEPGVGKTATIETDFAADGYTVETIVGSTREPTDFLGLPLPSPDGRISYGRLAWADRLAEADQGLLFLDELTTCAPSVQAAMLRIVQERVVGELALPDTVKIVAAANPPSIAVGGWDLAAPVANRFMHLDWANDSNAWHEGVMSRWVNQETVNTDSMIAAGDPDDYARAVSLVLGFLSTRPELENKRPDDPAMAGRGWPSFRSWQNAVDVLAHIRHDDDTAAFAAVKGCVGEATATEWAAWVSISDLRTPSEVISDPSIVDWSGERPDRIFALMSGIVTYARNNPTPAVWEGAVEAVLVCANNGRPDVASPAAKKLLNHKPDGASTPAGVVDAFSEIMTRAGFIEEGAAA